MTAAVYGPTLGHELLWWDDRAHLLDNPAFGDLEAAWTRPQRHIYMPITWSLWALAWRAGGGEPGWLHGLNLGAHLLGVALAWAVLRRLPGVTGAVAPLLGAALFALHPVQVEAVAWITSLKDLASADLALLALWLHLRGQGARGLGWQLGAVAALGLASLAKPTVAALAPAALAIHWAAGRAWRRPQVWAPLLGMAAACAPALWLTAQAQGAAQLPADPGPLGRALVALDALGSAIQAVLWPGIRLGCADRSVRWVLEEQRWLGPALVLAGAAWGATWARRRWPELAGGLLFLVALLLPVSGLLLFGAQRNTTVADRYLHLALLGPAWAAAAGWSRLPAGRARLAAATFTGAALLTLTGLTVALVPAWADDRALWTHTLRHDPDNLVALANLATDHGRRGDLRQATLLNARALERDPEQADVHNNLGAVLARAGRVADALPHFERAVRLDPHHADAWRHLATACRQLQRAEPLETALVATGMDPAASGPVTLELGEISLRAGELTRVEALMRRRLGRAPDDVEAHALRGVALGGLGRPVEAMAAFERALRLDPDHPVARENLPVARAAAATADQSK